MNDQNYQEVKDTQEQLKGSPQTELESVPKPTNKKKPLTKKKKLRLARLKRLKNLENLKNHHIEDLYNLIPSFSVLQYNFKSLFSIELNSFLITLVFITILTFSSNLGLYLPSRFEIASLNTTLKVGFFEQKTVFYPKFNFQRKHSKFAFYFQFKKKEDPFGLFSSQDTNTIEIRIKLITSQSKKLIKKFNITILKYYDIDVQPLFNIVLENPTNTIDLEVKFLGDLTNYKTFFIKSVVYNTTYLKYLKYYRFIFSVIGLFFIFHSFFSFLNFSNIKAVGLILILSNLPSFIFNTEKSIYGHIIQKIADQFFTQFILIVWIYHKCQQIQNKRPPNNRHNDLIIMKSFFTFLFLLEIHQMINILINSISETKNVYKYLSGDPDTTDKVFLFCSAFLVFIALFINFLNTGSFRVSVVNFFFFAAQASSFCDELVERCKVVKCIGMAKWMRLFTEPVALFFLIVLFNGEDSDLSERVVMAVPLNFEDESSMSRRENGCLE